MTPSKQCFQMSLRQERVKEVNLVKDREEECKKLKQPISPVIVQETASILTQIGTAMQRNI